MANIILTTTTITYLLMTTALCLAAVVAAPPLAAPASSPEPSDDCFTELTSMADCLNFVEKESRLKKPDDACCPELVNLTHTHPICLCQLLSNSSQFDLSIDTNRALILPSLCNVKISPAMCKGFDNAGLSILLPSKQHFLVGVLLMLFASIL